MKRCRSLLFMPGNNPGMLVSAQSLGADSVIFDLEDAVAQSEKDAARILVRNALLAVKPHGIPVIIRVNALDTPYWRADIAAAVQGGADCILAPKCSSVAYVQEMLDYLEQEEQKQQSRQLEFIALVESALGLENAFAMASSHPRVAGLLLGAEDLTAELGARRSPAGDEIFYARSRLLVACRAAGIKAIDSPYPFVTDLEGLEKDADFAARLGFDGKALISPHHVHLVNQAFTPHEDQIRWARRVMVAAARAKDEGKGAVSLDGMMIDLPVIKRAERILVLVDGYTEGEHA